MPDNGIQVIRAGEAAADADDLKIPVIALTAYRERRRKLLAEGFADLLVP
jgi:CheY-like chemotaxis protein